MEHLGIMASNAVKGFKTGASSLTSLGLFLALVSNTDVISVDLIKDAQILPGLLLGCVIPFLVSSLAMNTLQKVAKGILARVSTLSRSGDVNETANADIVRIGAISSLINLLMTTSITAAGTTIVYYAFGLKVFIGFLAGKEEKKKNSFFLSIFY
jgi:K(+)-stimulated pyrophosphate-energized sodium pump